MALSSIFLLWSSFSKSWVTKVIRLFSSIFLQLRELAGRKPIGKVVFDKKINRVSVRVNNEKNKFVAYIDGDRLDVYNSQKEAEKAATEFMKQYKGMK